jgi:predicted ArsR family transcriptional regulator
MQESFTPNGVVMLFLKKHAKSTTAQIAMHAGLRQRGVLRRALDGLDAKGVLQHTDDRGREILSGSHWIGTSQSP